MNYQSSSGENASSQGMTASSPSEGAGRHAGMTRRYCWALVGVALILGLAVRLPFLGKPGFPLGEGGLFVHFTQLILGHGFALPVEAAYGGQSLPFAYPPLAFYLAAAVARLTGADVYALFYWLPILLNLAAIPAFTLLATQVLRDRVAVVSATILYAILVHSFLWQITGGGLPRAIGALLALLAVSATFRAASNRSKAFVALAGALTGLTILSHLEWGMLAAMGVTLAYMTRLGLRQSILPTVISGSVAALVIAPWLLIVILRHGLAAFVSGAAGSQFNVTSFFFELFAGRFLGLLTWPIALGVFVAVKQRIYFLLYWAPLIMLVTPRMGASAGFAIPGAMLAGVGVRAAAAFITKRIQADPELSDSGRAIFDMNRFAGLGLVAAIVLATLSVLLVSPLRTGTADLSTMQQLSSDERAGMAWIKASTPSNARFVIVSEGSDWWADREAEWFPQLARRKSLTTAQGLEWAGPGLFTAKKEEIVRTKVVQIADPTLLPERIARQYCGALVAVFVPRPEELRRAFVASPKFRLIYSDPGTAVLQPATAAERCHS